MVGNPDDRFSPIAAHLSPVEPRLFVHIFLLTADFSHEIHRGYSIFWCEYDIYFIEQSEK